MTTIIQSNTYDFAIKKGEDYELEILVQDDDTREAIDLTGMSFTGDCRDHVHSDRLLFSFLFEINEVPDTGLLIMSISRDVTKNLAPQAGIYDVFVFHELEDRREPFMQGKITFEPEATHEQ